MVTDYQRVIQSRLEDMLQGDDLLCLNGKHIHFALEVATLYDDWTILKSDILEASLVNNFLRNIAEERDWIHANLIPTDDNNFLITIRVGAKNGNPNPSINTSYQINKIVKIIS
jgi:hypothetical protein